MASFRKLRALVRREMKEWLKKGWPFRQALQCAVEWIRMGGYGTPQKPQWKRPTRFPKEARS